MSIKYTREELLKIASSEALLIEELKTSFFAILKNFEKEEIFPEKSFFLNNLDVACFPFLFKNYAISDDDFTKIKKEVNYQKVSKDLSSGYIEPEKEDIEPGSKDFFDTSLVAIVPSTREDILNAFRGGDDTISYNKTHDFSLLEEIYEEGLLTGDNLGDVVSEKASWVLALLNNASKSELKRLTKEMIYNIDYIIQEADGFVEISKTLKDEISSSEYQLKYIKSDAGKFLNLGFFSEAVRKIIPVSEVVDIFKKAFFVSVIDNGSSKLFSTNDVGNPTKIYYSHQSDSKLDAWKKESPEAFPKYKEALEEKFPIFWDKETAEKNKDFLSKSVLGVSDSSKSLSFAPLSFNPYLYHDLSEEVKSVILNSDMVEKFLEFDRMTFQSRGVWNEAYHYDVYRVMLADLMVASKDNAEDFKNLMEKLSEGFDTDLNIESLFPIVKLPQLYVPELSIDFFDSYRHFPEDSSSEKAHSNFLLEMMKQPMNNFDKLFLINLAAPRALNYLLDIELNPLDIQLLRQFNPNLDERFVGNPNIPQSDANTNFIYRKEAWSNPVLLMSLLSLDGDIGKEVSDFVMGLPKDNIIALIYNATSEVLVSGKLDKLIANYAVENPDFFPKTNSFMDNLQYFPLAKEKISSREISYRDFSEMNIIRSEISNNDRDLIESLSVKFAYLSQNNLAENVTRYLKSEDSDVFELPLVTNEFILEQLIKMQDWQNNPILQKKDIIWLMDGLKLLSHIDDDLMDIAINKVQVEFYKTLSSTCPIQKNKFSSCIKKIASLNGEANAENLNKIVEKCSLITVFNEVAIDSFLKIDSNNMLKLLNDLKDVSLAHPGYLSSLVDSYSLFDKKLNSIPEDVWNKFLSQDFTIEEKIRIEVDFSSCMNSIPMASTRALLADRNKLSFLDKENFVENPNSLDVRFGTIKGVHGFLFPELMSPKFVKQNKSEFEALYNNLTFEPRNSIKLTQSFITKGTPFGEDVEVIVELVKPKLQKLAQNDFEEFIDSFYKKNQQLEQSFVMSEFVNFNDDLFIRFFSNFAYPFTKNKNDGEKGMFNQFTSPNLVIEVIKFQMFSDSISNEAKEHIVDVVNIFNLKKEIPLNKILAVDEHSYSKTFLSHPDLKSVVDTYSLSKMLDNQFANIPLISGNNEEDEMSSGFKM